jgi:hypothetical protein
MGNQIPYSTRGSRLAVTAVFFLEPFPGVGCSPRQSISLINDFSSSPPACARLAIPLRRWPECQGWLVEEP